MAKGIKGFQKGHNHSEETKKKIGLANSKQITFNCDNCGCLSSDKPSSFHRKKRHFCCRDCYSKFRKTKLPFEEQHSYKGVVKSREEKQEYHRRYVKKNPERISHLKARRYAREKNAEGSHSLEEWLHLKEKHAFRCANCNEKKKLTKDHIIPLSKGGTDYIDNIQPLCRNCNSKKWNFLYENPELLEESAE